MGGVLPAWGQPRALSDRAGRGAGRALRPLGAALSLGGVFLLLAGAAGAVDEVEPNDGPGAAQAISAAGSFVVLGNASASTDPVDYFRWTFLNASVVELILTSTWGCAGAACENLSVLEPNGSSLIDPFGDPMNGTDVYFSGLPGDVYYIRLAAGSPGGSYSLRAIVYPFNYIASQHVDVSAANQSSAIVAFASADLKSSTHPYDLQLEGDRIYYGYSLRLFVVNVGPLDLTVDVPSGLIFESEDGRFTDYVVTRDQVVSVPAWTYRDAEFIAVAESPYAWVPGDPSRPNNQPTYFIGPRAAGELLKITDETDRESYAYQAEQIAVWAWTAGQNQNDFFTLGASTSARNEAVTILNRAQVYTAINPTPRSNLWLWLVNLFGSPFYCYMILFLGLPFLFGISQAMRAVRLGRMHIDAGYAVSRASRGSARAERRAYIREARRREKERRRDRRREERADSLNRRAIEKTKAPVSPPAVVAAVAAASPAPAMPATKALGPFLAMDAFENFDLDGLNQLDYNTVLGEAMPTKALAAETSKKTEALLTRLHQDIGDPDTIDDILRDRLVLWYRESPSKGSWAERASHAWSGLVAESKAAGGRKRTPLEKRLGDLKEACDARGKWIKPKPKKEAGGSPRRGVAAPPPDPAAVKAQVVQAVLDDLAAGQKPAEPAYPLPVLSELAAKLTTQRVNQALAEIFKADVRGPYVILHPSRYPDCDITAIRPPAQGAKGGAMAYEIFFADAPARAAAGQPAGATVSAGGPTPGLLDTSAAIWEREKVPREEWAAVLSELQQQRQRLDPPPGNFRKLPPYFTLREVLLGDEAARRTFLAVKWRGKPVSLPLLVQILVDKALTPEFDTDREYFEAELGDLERGDVTYQPASGQWTIAPGLVVKREADGAGAITYKL